MKKIFALLVAVCTLCTVSCYKHENPDADFNRHIVTGLTAIPGDSHVELRWALPKGWTPTEYIIKYTDPDQNVVKTVTDEIGIIIQNLQNGFEYTFVLQAVYAGGKISGEQRVKSKPVTTRPVVSSLEAEGGDKFVVLNWVRPDSDRLQGYVITYVSETGDKGSIEVDSDLESYVLTGLENDVIYTITVLASYPNGESLPVKLDAMPCRAIPYILDRNSAAVGQPVTFKFNRSDYPEATNVSWEFPDGVKLEGDEVSKALQSAGEQKIKLSAFDEGKTKSWTVKVNIRQWVVSLKKEFYASGAYTGFKGTCPVFSPDGKTVYIITFAAGARLYAVDTESGNIKWTHGQGTMQSYNPLTVNPVTGDIYYGLTTAGNFFAVSPSGTELWKYTGLGSCQSAAPAVSKDGNTVYAVDATGKVVALDTATGKEKWTASCGAKGGGLIVNGPELVVGVNGIPSVFFLNITDGSQIANLSTSTKMTDISGFAVAADGETAYVPCTEGKLARINLTSHTLVNEIQLSTFALDGWSPNNLYEPCVSPVNGDVFVAGKDSRMYCVKGDLSAENWHIVRLAATNNAFNYSHPCVDAEGNYYITSGSVQNVNYVIASDGTLRDSWQYDGSNNMQMGGNNLCDGVFYSAFIGANNDNGEFIGKYVGANRGNGWSSHGGDICGSCCIK